MLGSSSHQTLPRWKKISTFIVESRFETLSFRFQAEFTTRLSKLRPKLTKRHYFTSKIILLNLCANNHVYIIEWNKPPITDMNWLHDYSSAASHILILISLFNDLLLHTHTHTHEKIQKSNDLWLELRPHTKVMWRFSLKK